MDVAKISPAAAGYLPITNNSSLIPAVSRNVTSVSDISDLSRTLYQSNIDLSKSTISVNAASTDFSIQFLRQTEQKATLNGFYSNDLTAGSISFSFNYINREVKEGKTIEREFAVNFDFSFSANRSISIEKSEKKEDILDFLRRITKEIITKLNDNNVNIKSVVLDPEDLKDLAQLSDKKIKQLINQLIEMIKYTTELKMMANKNKNARDYVYTPKRIKEDVIEIKESNELNISYSFSIKETYKTTVNE